MDKWPWSPALRAASALPSPRAWRRRRPRDRHRNDGGRRRAYYAIAGFPRGRGAQLDVASQASIDALLADIDAREGPIEILCNNAGIARDALLLRMKADDWDAVLQTNLASVFRLSKAVMRGMLKARKGRIISIASVIGLTGNAGQSNYAAAKAGMIGFSKSLAREVGSRGITVNVVAPGFIETDMTRGLDAGQKGALDTQIRWRGWASRRTSPRRWRFLRRRTPLTSPGRRCTSMAGCTWPKWLDLSRHPSSNRNQMRVHGSRRRCVHIKYAPCRYRRLAASPCRAAHYYLAIPKGHHNDEYC